MAVRWIAVRSITRDIYSYLRVDDFVLFQTDGVTKRFPTQLARERPRATVRAPGVDLQAMRRRKDLDQIEIRLRSDFGTEIKNAQTDVRNAGMWKSLPWCT